MSVINLRLIACDLAIVTRADFLQFSTESGVIFIVHILEGRTKTKFKISGI